MKALSIRIAVTLLAASLCVVPSFEVCYHTDGGTCVEARAGDCCAETFPTDGASQDQCPDCADVLASVAIPMSRPELSAVAPGGTLLALLPAGDARLSADRVHSPHLRDGPQGRSTPGALLSRPLRC